MNATIFAFVVILSAALAGGLGLPWVNPITGFAAVWVPLLFIASIPGLVQPALNQDTWNMVWIALAGVALGCLLGALIGAVSSRARGSAIRDEFTVSVSRLVKWHWLLTGALAGYAILQLYKLQSIISSVGGWTAIFSTTGLDFRRAQLDAAHAAPGVSVILINAAGYILFLGHASLITGAILWRIGRRYIALAPLFVSAIYSTLVLQRTFFFIAVLIFVAAAVLFPLSALSKIPDRVLRANSPVSGVRSAVAQLVVVTLTIVGLLLPLQFRGDTEGTSLFQYLLSGIVGLSVREQTGNLTPAPGAGYGSYTFSALFRILNQMEVPVPVSPAYYDFYDIYVAGVTYPTNTGTSILDFSLDFGVVGMGVVFFVIAFAASVMQQLELRNRVYALPITAALLVTLFWSFFVTPILNDFKYLLAAIFGCFVVAGVTKFSQTAPPKREELVKAQGHMPTTSHESGS